jgi:hypothetical protein
MLNIILSGPKQQELRGAAYLTAGITKTFGLKFLRERKVLDQLKSACFGGKKIEPMRTIAGLQLIETLSYALGKSFEPFIKEILQNILNSISHPNDAVRKAAN